MFIVDVHYKWEEKLSDVINGMTGLLIQQASQNNEIV
jgi:hypothetical protein